MNRTVAFLDILGFRSLVESESAEKVGQRLSHIVGGILPAMNRRILETSEEPTFFPHIAVGAPFCSAHVFSDSIILVSQDDTENSALALLVYTLRATQIMIVSGLPVRGGVSYGDMYVDAENSCFAGSALTHAYDLEQRQDWIGVAIEESVASSLPGLFDDSGPFPDVRKCLFPTYEIPMKSGLIVPIHTVNWRWNLVIERGTRSLFDERSDWSARRKITASLAFAQHIRQAGLAYAKNDSEVPVEVRRFYVGGGAPPSSPPRHGDEY